MPQTETPDAALMRTDLPLPARRQGKVRDIYEATTRQGRPVMVIVATDRISAFDVVMPNGVPHKGRVLNQLSAFWFDQINTWFGDTLPHHLLSTDPDELEGLTPEQCALLRGRVSIGRRCKVVPIECVARGYLAGSGWKEYQRSQSVCGVALPPGLRQCDRLPEPIFTPATKAEEGHDENISFEQACAITGEDLMRELRRHTLSIYERAHAFALERGLILADTKFEFGVPLDSDDTFPILIDEALTPDSSRYWPADTYEPGHDQPSFDKQFVRNYLEELIDQDQWDRQPPGPTLPEPITAGTLERYREAFVRLTGQEPELNPPR